MSLAAPLKTVRVPVVETVVNGLTNSSAPAIVMLHGYPDDESMWDIQVAHFAKTHKIVRLVIPNFGKTITDPRGFDFPELIEGFRQAIDRELGDTKKFALMTHDWGAILGYMLESHPVLRASNRITRLVAADIGGCLADMRTPVGQPQGRLSLVCMGLYQTIFAIAYLCAAKLPWVGHFLGLLMIRLTMLCFSLVGPFVDPAHANTVFSLPKRKTALNPLSNYLYLHILRNSITKTRPLHSDAFGWRPACPVLFIHGTAGFKKLIAFHGRGWEAFLQERHIQDGCSKSIAFSESSHWCMHDQPMLFNSECDAFFAKCDAAAKK